MRANTETSRSSARARAATTMSIKTIILLFQLGRACDISVLLQTYTVLVSCKFHIKGQKKIISLARKLVKIFLVLTLS